MSGLSLLQLMGKQKLVLFSLFKDGCLTLAPNPNTGTSLSES
jgi:hypothetical protein